MYNHPSNDRQKFMQTKGVEQSIIVITGMHRSGTSLTASICQNAGVDIGTKLMGSNRSNSKGHFENLDFLDLHKKILQSQGMNDAGYTLQEKIDVEEHYKEEAKKIIAENSRSQIWGWKDPRTTLFLDFWADLLPEAFFLLVYRSPWEVVDSLYRRSVEELISGHPNQLFLSHPDLAVKIWSNYNQKILEFYDKFPERCHLTSIYQVTENTKLFIDTINSKFNINLSVPDTKIYDNSLLRTEITNVPGATIVNHYFPQALNIYKELELKANRIDEADGQSWCPEINSSRYRVKAFQNWLAIRNLEKKHKSIQAKIEQTEAQLEQTSTQLEQTSAQLKQAKLNQQQTQTQLEQTSTQLKQAKSKQQQTQAQLEQTQKELHPSAENLVNVIQQFDSLVTSMVESNRWKLGNLIYVIYRKILLKSIEPSPQEHQKKLVNIFQTWQDDFRNKHITIKSLNKKNYLKNNSYLPKTNYELFRQSPLKHLADTSLSIDIIVCVHNALDDVKLCLESIENNTYREYTLFIVNDGSDEQTTEYLRYFSSKRKHCVLIENSTAQGYTKAANKGLKASQGDYTILLNSDTIVSKLWIERLLECAESDPRIGIVGPLSNAASWQSVPKLFDDKGDWAINSLPEGFSVNDFAEIVNLASQKIFPRVPFLNGFCFVIKRNLIEAIGYLDEENFPKGYGEENDYCLRAANADFELAIADHAYVYHSKSKSYGHQTRKVLAQAGGKALKRKHGKTYIDNLIKEMRHNKTLNDIGYAIELCLGGHSVKGSINPTSIFSILFLLPVRPGGGGVHSVVQEAVGMRKVGVDAQIAIQQKHIQNYHINYPELIESKEVFYCYQTLDNLTNYASQFKVVVATINNSIQILQKIVQSNSSIMPAYYIQDYEPWFYEKGSHSWEIAKNSYNLIPGTVLFAKTRWLCEIVEQKHSVKVEKVSSSLDQSVYYPNFMIPNQNDPIVVVAMARPSTPRRGASRTMKILKKLKLELGASIDIHVFGCDDRDLNTHNLEINFDFKNHGVLIREQVAELLRKADIFLDLSDYQAFGRTGLEAMACGCAVVLPQKGGVHEYAIDGDNAILVDTALENDCYTEIVKLISDPEWRREIQKNALLKAAEYSIYKASVSEVLLLKDKWSQNRQKFQAHIKQEETAYKTQS
ncbi:MAG: glycosyltransferase [Xenococcaceae cyanobacterium MO_188.B32]|nr:glycosyltransferase [Xenococcaceae cyanobacterium MO_188.B32]